MRDKIIGFIISVVCFIISLGFVKGQAMALPFVPTDWTWEMYQGLHMLGDLIANDVNFDIPDWVDFNDFDDVKTFLEMIYNEGKKKSAYASIIADFCVGTWNNFLETGEVSLPFSESTVKRTHNTGFFQHIVDTVTSDVVITQPDLTYSNQLDIINGAGYDSFKDNIQVLYTAQNVPSMVLFDDTLSYCTFADSSSPQFGNIGCFPIGSIYIYGSGDVYSYDCSFNLIDNFSYCNIGNGSLEFYGNNGFRVNNNFDANNRDLGTYWGGWSHNYVSKPTYAETFSGTLANVLNHISFRFHNINIYVNDVPWSYVEGVSIDNPLGVEIPQNVIDEVENGKISGLVIDATLPDTDNLVGSIDLGVVMDELREAQANGRIATLDGVRTKDGVRALDGTVVGTVSKAVAIDVPSTASLVTAADEWGYIPYYPEIPSAFSGTTILSELIDATQTIFPNELIMAIWGLVIILFIIALINIFHK